MQAQTNSLGLGTLNYAKDAFTQEEASRRPDILVHLEYLNTEINALDNVLCQLIDKLEPVLSATVNEDKLTGPVENAVTGLSLTIQEKCHRISGLRRMVNNTLSRLEL